MATEARWLDLIKKAGILPAFLFCQSTGFLGPLAHMFQFVYHVINIAYVVTGHSLDCAFHIFARGTRAA